MDSAEDEVELALVEVELLRPLSLLLSPLPSLLLPLRRLPPPETKVVEVEVDSAEDEVEQPVEQLHPPPRALQPRPSHHVRSFVFPFVLVLTIFCAASVAAPVASTPVRQAGGGRGGRGGFGNIVVPPQAPAGEFLLRLLCSALIAVR